jgi:predicted dehydrogenase
MTAIQMKKHVFVQKPLTHTVYEARKLAEAAKKTGVVTQMGNQGHAGEGARLINEWIWDGAIGDVTEVHTWTNRPVWPQNIERPITIPSVPPTLDWNQWLGPAPWRPYHPAYVPFTWRGWWDFGVGALGDMGAHIIDHPFWALDLGYPDTVQATSTPYNDETYPLASVITYQFPARGEKPPVTLKWFDGGILPPRPEELEAGRMMGEIGGGVIFIGTKGKLMCSVYGENPRLIPETKMKEYKRPEKTIPRSPGIHQEWAAACKGEGETTSHFEYAGKLTEMMLLGNIAMKVKDKNSILQWDGPNMRFTNLEEANQYLTKEYREGWSL